MAKIFPLYEGEFTVGNDKQLIPFDSNRDKLEKRSTGSLHIVIQPFLVVTDKDLIILDTGLGLKDKDGNLQIHKNLIDLGYEPTAITKVFHSHLHGDHAGGVIFTDNQNNVHSTFPNADYYLYRNEADYALKTGLPAYNAKKIEEFLLHQQIKWLDGEEGVIDGYIRFMHTGGHSQHHIVFLIDDGIDKVFYGGDEAPQLKQLQIKFVAKYDYDGRKALEIRKKYADLGKKEGWKFLFYHDVKCAIASL